MHKRSNNNYLHYNSTLNVIKQHQYTQNIVVGTLSNLFASWPSPEYRVKGDVVLLKKTKQI